MRSPWKSEVYDVEKVEKEFMTLRRKWRLVNNVYEKE